MMGYYRDRWREQPPWIKIPFYAVFGTAAAVLFGLLFGMVVVWLWNWLMPTIFGLPEITFWQGVGMFILAKLLFGGIGSSHNEEKKHHKPPADKPYCGSMHGPADHGHMEHGPAHGFENWRYYDEWWHSQGKDAFTDYVEQMGSVPPPPDAPQPDKQPDEE